MNSRNLIPAQRQVVKRRQHAVRKWLLIDSIYLLLCVIGAVGTLTALHNTDQSETATAAGPIGQSAVNVAALAQEVAGLRTHLQSVREVTDRPDWSILLAALSQTLGDDMVLNSVDCTEGGVGSDKSLTTNGSLPEAFRITGIGQSQNSVTRFVLAVENLHFFLQVRLVQTAPQSLRGRNCVGFLMICTIPRDIKGGELK